MRKEIQDIQKRQALGLPADTRALLREVERLEDVLVRRTRIAGLARMLLLEKHRVLLAAVATVARYAEFCGNESVPASAPRDMAASVARLLRDLAQNVKG